MRIFVALLAALFVAPGSGAFAQGTCPQEFVACMNTCVNPKTMDRCAEGCQQKNTACAAAVWHKPPPSYENLTRPEDPAPVAEIAPPAPVKKEALVPARKETQARAKPKRQPEPTGSARR